MSFTQRTELEVGDGWVAVYDGTDGGMVQLDSDGPVQIGIFNSAPGGSDTGATLVKNGLTEMGWTELPDTGDAVYAKAVNGAEAVIVIAGGSAPA